MDTFTTIDTQSHVDVGSLTSETELSPSCLFQTESIEDSPLPVDYEVRGPEQGATWFCVIA